MIRRFCDPCGKEISKSANRSQFKHQFTNEDLEVNVMVDTMVTINGATNSGDICAECIIKTVSEGVYLGMNRDI